MAKSTKAPKKTANGNTQIVNPSITLTLSDLKIVSEKIGVPYLELLLIIFNISEPNVKANLFEGLGPGHPRLLSVVPTDIEKLLAKQLKTKKK